MVPPYPTSTRPGHPLPTRLWFLARTVFFLTGCFVASQARLAHAQTFAEPTSADTSSEAQPLAVAFSQGVEAFQAEQYQEATAHLAPVFEAEPGFFLPELGSAAFWLGQAYQAEENAEAASDVWAEGWTELAAEAIIDLRLADALIEQTFTQHDSARYAEAASAYLTLLRNLEGRRPAALQPIKARHLIPLTFILPPDVRDDVGLPDVAAAADSAGLRAGAGAALVAWWRSMDNLPATATNERLTEHLERVIYAREHFANRKSETGFDDRAEIYIRFGKPSHTKPITFDLMSLTRVVDREAGMAYIDPNVPSFPDTELWVYRNIDRSAHYLFVEKAGRGLRLATSYDVIPSELRTRLRRGRKNQLVLHQAMEEMYVDLALYHSETYGRALMELDNGRLPLDQLLFQARHEEQRAAYERDEAMPASHSSLFDGLDDLPVALRTARFLDEDGTTRTELYWTLPARALRPSRRLRKRLRKAEAEPSEEYLINLTVAQQTSDYRTRYRETKHHLVRLADPRADSVVLAPQQFVAHGDTGRYHLALQWDAHWAYRQDGGIRPGPKLMIGSYRADTLDALASDAGRLEMSDLKPLLMPEDAPLDAALASPYPNGAITPETPLALYFEVYHLNFDAGDQARYTVAYEVTRQEQKGGLKGLFGGKAEKRTSAETEYTGESRTARETILLDLGTSERAGEVAVAVRVTDETTGQTVERSLSFEVME